MSNLIFVEGISGVGKSTISNVLCERLRSFGYSAYCILEGDSDSPLDLFYVSYLTGGEYRELLRSYPAWSDELQKKSLVEPDYALVRYQDTKRKYYSPELYGYLKEHELCYNTENPVPLSKFSEVFVNLWRLFAEKDIIKQDNLIFDGSLLHHQVNDLIRNYNATEDQIAAYLSVLIRTIESLNPMVFYLSTQDVCSQLTKARQSRGQTPPAYEQIVFWQKRKQMDLSLLERLPVKSRIIDISDGNWDSALENIFSSITTSDDSPL
jgi:hypothetical protein